MKKLNLICYCLLRLASIAAKHSMADELMQKVKERAGQGK